MIYKEAKRKNPLNSGVTFVEILVVLTILSILLLGITPKIINSFNKYQTQTTFDDLVQTIRIAQLKSMQNEGGTTYGVHLSGSQPESFILFKGADYVTRDTSYDQVHQLPSILDITYNLGASSSDMVFSKYEGITPNFGTISIAWTGGGITKVISVSSYGVITKL